MASANHYIDPDDKIWSFVSSIVMDEGLCLYDLMRPRQDSLRVFVDKPKLEEGKRGSGVTSGECSNVCKRLRHSLVVEGEGLGLTSEPELEVSSPGLERELRLPVHFDNAVGLNVKVTAKDKYISGLLEAFSDETLCILESASKEAEKVLFNEVKKAQVVFV